MEQQSSKKFISPLDGFIPIKIIEMKFINTVTHVTVVRK